VLIVPVNEARPGQKLALGVVNPQVKGQELLKAGFVLEPAIIERLKSLRVTQICVDFPGLEDLDTLIIAQMSPERREVYQQVKNAIADNEKSANPVVKYTAYVEATRSLIKTMLGRPENAMLLDVLNTSDDEVEHATSVAHLSLTLGLKLDAYLIRERARLPAQVAKDVTSLGVAGMLHDIGKTKLAEPLRKYHSLNPPKSETETAEWQKHTQIGYEMVRSGTDATTAAAILHHHQRFDGKGFPRLIRGENTIEMSGSQIHCFARILTVADVFDRVARSGVAGSRLTNFAVIHALQTGFNGWFDPEVLAVLPQVVPPFSPGRRVTLSDQSIAVVTGFNPYAPYQPTVKRLDASGESVVEATIDLKRDTGLGVVALDGVPLEELKLASRDSLPP
jgi:HD-GYP domain-containing protein (c-di-GMP phosphodiesterase class II)